MVMVVATVMDAVAVVVVLIREMNKLNLQQINKSKLAYQSQVAKRHSSETSVFLARVVTRLVLATLASNIKCQCPEYYHT